MKPYRSKKYCEWIRSLPCVVTGQEGCDNHHIIGYGLGGMGTKASDLFQFPLIRLQHTDLHNDPVKWEQWNGPQMRYVGSTLYKAITQGVLTYEEVEAEINSQVIRHEYRKELFKCLDMAKC